MSFLEVKGLFKSFENTEVLKGIDLTLEKGEVLSIVGSSGSGKTTLLRCLNFLERAEAGEVYLEGELLFNASENKKLSDGEIREKRLNFGLVFQQFNLFPQYNVLTNVKLAPTLMARAELSKNKNAIMAEHNITSNAEWKEYKKSVFAEIENEAKETIAKVGLADKMYNYPTQLSGGQQQRVAIARALILKPKVLFFDEPTSALDPELTGEILKVIKSLADKKMTMVIVTHEMSFARDISDKVIFMADGIVLEEGSPEDVLVNPKNERIRAFLEGVSSK